jgi:general secretion pathway protein G
MKNLRADRIATKDRGRCLVNSGGFTLLEIIVTLAILSVLAGLAAIQYADYIEKARVVRAIVEIKDISQALDAYNQEKGAYPPSLAEVGYANMLDPWGSPYRYLNIQTATRGQRGSFRRDRFLVPINTDYDLYSIGKDHQSSSPLTAKPSQDDVVRANNGGYIGLASQF